MNGSTAKHASLTLPGWAGILLALQCLYLFLEFAFNARLVDSVLVTDKGYFEYLSHIGRLLSGAGCTLLIFSLLRKWKPQSRATAVMAHIVAAAIAFPTVYYGQEELIDSMVEGSSAEQRMHAQYLALLKRGLAANAVVFSDIEFEPEDIERPEAKTFINTIGFTVFFAPGYIQAVVENSDPILKHLARRQSHEKLGKAYSQYLEARSKISRLSEKYNEANSKYLEKLNKTDEQAREIWSDVYVQLQEQWREINADSRKARLQEALDLLYDRLDMFFLARRECEKNHGTELCLEKVNEKYHEQMRKAFGKKVEPQYWCKTIPGGTRSVFEGGRFVEKSIPESMDCSIEHRDFIRRRFLKLEGLTALGYEDFNEFAASKEVADRLRRRLAEKGIRMPAGYRLRNHQSFIKGVKSELSEKLREKFRDLTRDRFGTAVPPLLSTEEFLRHSVIQDPLKKALDLPPNAPPISVSLSEKEFNQQILIPQIERSLAGERARLLAKAPLFADGAAFEQEGKLYVRSLLIPPIAMGLSMFFALLNLSSIVADLLAKVRTPEKLIGIGRAVFITVIIVIPIVRPIHIAETEAFQRIVHETEETLGVGRYFVIWLTGLQPTVYPIGHNISESLNLFEPPKEENR